MITWGLVSRLIALLTALLVAPIAGGSGTLLSAAASAAPATYTYDASAYAYDALARSSSPDSVASYVRGSPPASEVASWVSHVSVEGDGVAAETAEAGAARVAAGAEEACAGGACRVPGRMCFVAGTGVLLASAATVAIEDVKVGDRVLTTDLDTGRESAHAVTRLYRHENAPLFDVVIDGSIVTATPTHPFWVVGRGWVTVDQLHAGDALLQPDDTTVTVDAVHATGQTATVYNFEVEDAHDYYVKAGDHWVLVHNDCGPTIEAALDATGKVHGPLPRPGDLAQFAPEELAILRSELAVSVQTRIARTVELGADYGHNARLAQEHQLIQSIDRLLGN